MQFKNFIATISCIKTNGPQKKSKKKKIIVVGEKKNLKQQTNAKVALKCQTTTTIYINTYAHKKLSSVSGFVIKMK